MLLLRLVLRHVTAFCFLENCSCAIVWVHRLAKQMEKLYVQDLGSTWIQEILVGVSP
ncbi:unnamed protein product [Acanthoscelides obtectus]|uniref:Uncharacterized protein n=1 Tax=Acanthoscelides obtectus TaxID=200917 RepID=A0A9P0KAN8_ACAOB|nr:unnamed protein product [Acanthoscelides obtectus]CAK1648344.1 hypothetical protein AOBTE_LOCUS15685 [Acanthoscelides obtectus]